MHGRRTMVEAKRRCAERIREEQEKRKSIQKCDAYVSWPSAMKLVDKYQVNAFYISCKQR
jgi:hypothetical protein